LANRLCASSKLWATGKDVGGDRGDAPVGGGPDPGGEPKKGKVEGFKPEAAEAPCNISPGNPARAGIPG